MLGLIFVAIISGLIVFVPFVHSRTNRKVLLILDNAPRHAEAFEHDAIRVIFFLANQMSHLGSSRWIWESLQL